MITLLLKFLLRKLHSWGGKVEALLEWALLSGDCHRALCLAHSNSAQGTSTRRPSKGKGTDASRSRSIQAKRQVSQKVEVPQSHNKGSWDQSYVWKRFTYRASEQKFNVKQNTSYVLGNWALVKFSSAFRFFWKFHFIKKERIVIYKLFFIYLCKYNIKILW